ncbi:ParB N-terminal domain-containing protein [bacterium]|nr:ParB N-terminal domain-containing protein [bacterium]
MKIINIPLKEIREDFSFCFTSRKENFQLHASVLKSGVRTPLHVHQLKGGYRAISGFKRICIAKTLGMKTIPAEVVDDSSLPDIFIHVIHEQVVHYPLTLVEKARAIGICEALGMSRKRMIKDILPILDLPGRPDLFQQLKRIRNYPKSVQQYFEQFDISLKKFYVFSILNAEALELAMQIAGRIGLRPVELSEIVTLITEIGKRESLSFKQVYNDLNLDPVIEEPELSRNAKVDLLKMKLKERRYPRLLDWQQRLEDMRKSMLLPSCVHVCWDANLETPGVLLKATFRSSADVDKTAEFIRNKKNRALFEKMFQIV